MGVSVLVRHSISSNEVSNTMSIFKYGKNIDIFAEKNVKKYSHFCSNINVFENILATRVNEFVIKELVKLTML